MFNFLKDENGSQTLEFVALIPFFLIMMLMVWQFGLTAYTMVVAESAAHDGARAAAAGNDGIRAAQKTAYGFKVQAREKKTRSEVSYTVILDVPLVKLPFLADQRITISGRATMPIENSL